MIEESLISQVTPDDDGDDDGRDGGDAATCVTSLIGGPKGLILFERLILLLVSTAANFSITFLCPPLQRFIFFPQVAFFFLFSLSKVE